MGDPEPGPEPDVVLRWDALPEPVRTRLAALASGALDGLPEAEVPFPLRRLARFVPAKRSRVGAGQLLTALRDSAAFRSAVRAWWEEHRADELDPDLADAPAAAAAAAAAVLADAPDAAALVARVSRQTDTAGLRTERDAALARVGKLTAEVERLRAELAAVRDGVRAAGRARDTQLERLRRRVSEQGARLRAATEAVAAAEAALDEQRSAAAEELAAARADRDREQARAHRERVAAEEARAEAAAARQAAREARRGDEVRLELLLDTASGALDGLRRELALGGSAAGGPRPADLVPGASDRGAAHGGQLVDVRGLDRLLALRAVHLVVDGYNVSKTGYPELTLAEQRDRLARSLGALVARTGAEVTVVFDGAGVAAGGTRAPRGVRVLFSDPGVLADDVIRAMVDAEPAGRPVAVATSDRALADSVRRRGAEPVASAVLLDRLTRS